MTFADDYNLRNPDLVKINDIADVVDALYPTFTAWTPSYSAINEMTYETVTTASARYATFGKIIIATVRTTAGTTGGTTSSRITVSAPAGITLVATSFASIGCMIKEGGVIQTGYVCRNSESTFGVMREDTSNWALVADTWFGFTFVGEIA